MRWMPSTALEEQRQDQATAGPAPSPQKASSEAVQANRPRINTKAPSKAE